jgi:SOS-response transcriptional repressor LexA
MTDKVLTAQQRKVYEFIVAFQQIRKITPSYSEIAAGLNLKSKSNIWRLVHELKERKLIKIQPHIARSISVTDNDIKEVSAL